MNIKVLGGGCKSCEALLKAVKEAVELKGIDAKVEYITDMEKIMNYGVMSMPMHMWGRDREATQFECYRNPDHGECRHIVEGSSIEW